MLLSIAIGLSTGRIDGVTNNREFSPDDLNPFSAGAIVIVTLANPREKFWGSIRSLAPEGLSLRGIELASFEDLLNMIKDGDSFTSGVVFFPMHRVERMELDLPDDTIPSLSQRFAAKTGMDPAQLFGLPSSQPIGGRG